MAFRAAVGRPAMVDHRVKVDRQATEEHPGMAGMAVTRMAPVLGGLGGPLVLEGLLERVARVEQVARAVLAASEDLQAQVVTVVQVEIPMMAAIAVQVENRGKAGKVVHQGLGL